MKKPWYNTDIWPPIVFFGSLALLINAFPLGLVWMLGWYVHGKNQKTAFLKSQKIQSEKLHVEEMSRRHALIKNASTLNLSAVDSYDLIYLKDIFLGVTDELYKLQIKPSKKSARTFINEYFKRGNADHIDELTDLNTVEELNNLRRDTFNYLLRTKNIDDALNHADRTSNLNNEEDIRRMIEFYKIAQKSEDGGILKYSTETLEEKLIVGTLIESEQLQLNLSEQDFLLYKDVIESCDSPPEILFIKTAIHFFSCTLGSKKFYIHWNNKRYLIEPQKSLPPYRVDFLVNNSRVIEIDGKKYHSETFEYDRKRDQKILSQYKYETSRLTAKQVFQNPRHIIEEVLKWTESSAEEIVITEDKSICFQTLDSTQVSILLLAESVNDIYMRGDAIINGRCFNKQAQFNYEMTRSILNVDSSTNDAIDEMITHAITDINSTSNDYSAHLVSKKYVDRMIISLLNIANLGACNGYYLYAEWREQNDIPQSSSTIFKTDSTYVGWKGITIDSPTIIKDGTENFLDLIKLKIEKLIVYADVDLRNKTLDDNGSVVIHFSNIRIKAHGLLKKNVHCDNLKSVWESLRNNNSKRH